MGKARVYIGTSGYSYDHWAEGVFYPSDLPKNKWLEHYVKSFKTVELNVTFYRLPTKAVFSGWHKRTPAGFTFAVKGSRFITHIKRLKDCQEPLDLFLNRAGALRNKLSVVLWQLPPKFGSSPARLSDFVKRLKRPKGLRHVFEFRDESWFSDEIFKILEKANIAICAADWPEFAKGPPLTADFAYIRRHGPGESLYAGCYPNDALKKDAARIKKMMKDGIDVYIYFNNDAHGWAVKNARTLQKFIKGNI
ncbi:MAG: hypothetical protein AMJ78_04115 [Omnitrophica WOR_2 bacterium SM23_29]|nr:MAG: hypothetical protein AMJ78_04115 [Omnitrophica WOR_2 bacterium SM23_29]